MRGSHGTVSSGTTASSRFLLPASCFPMTGYLLHQTASEEAFTAKAVELIKGDMTGAFADHGQCILGLSGGSTPRPIYEALGKEAFDWPNVNIFLVDERCVPANHRGSNQGMVRETLLRFAPIPEKNISFPDTSLPVEECIEQFTRGMKNLIRTRLPDICVLGMGEDGHIASLFPPVPDIALTDRVFALHTATNSFAVRDRITLSLNVIAAAGSHVILLKGSEKKHMWEEMLASPEGEDRWPMKRLLAGGSRVDIVVFW